MNQSMRQIFNPATEQPLRFVSAYPMEVSVRRLRKVTAPRRIFGPKTQSMVGRVAKDHVRLERAIPGLHGAFRQYFEGRFLEERGQVVLTGRLVVHWGTQLFVAALLGFGLLWIVGVGLLAIITPGIWPLLLIGGGIVLSGLGYVYGGRWLGQQDIIWLSAMIEEALGAKPSN
ncbi:hypothetical protein LDO31_13355 [Luteimonas sp. XNQY3]|nr:hypothetical protein [Luteimonas sp. XNQY3]MCD9007204.1 hypothetical protein [Luteimonas sp. XNQY3]